MVTNDPQAVAWSVELRSSGRVCVDVSRFRATVYLVVGALLTALAVGFLFVPGIAVKLFGCLLLPIMAYLFTISFMQLFRIGSWASPVVVVDQDGITARRGYLQVPWADLYGAYAYQANHNRWLALVVSPECYDIWVAARPLVIRLLARRPRRRRHGTVSLPPNLRVDTEVFAAWITDETQARIVAQA